MDDALTIGARKRAERRRDRGEWARQAALEEHANRRGEKRRRASSRVDRGGARASWTRRVFVRARAGVARSGGGGSSREGGVPRRAIKPPRKNATRRTHPPPRAPSPEEVAYTTDFETADATTEAEETYTTDFDVDDENEAVVGPTVDSPTITEDATNENDVVEPLPVVPDIDAMVAAARAIDAALNRAMDDIVVGEAVDAALDETVALVVRWKGRRDRAAEKATLDERLARGSASLEATARAKEESAAAREAEERERVERETIVATRSSRTESNESRVLRGDDASRALGHVRAILDESTPSFPAVATVEEPDLKRRITILRAKNEALRARLAWERKLEFTPRAVLRRKPFEPEEVAIIRSTVRSGCSNRQGSVLRSVRKRIRSLVDASGLKPPGWTRTKARRESRTRRWRWRGWRRRSGKGTSSLTRRSAAGSSAAAPPIAIGHDRRRRACVVRVRPRTASIASRS